jgi:NADH:ubiquinone oxidoreductase subunit 3 (subunit A)
MEEEKVLVKLEEQDAKINAIYKSVEQTRKLFLATLIITVLMFVVPAIGLVFIIPWFLNVMSSAYSGLL